jgi:tRNA (guanine37-N1)-methyltransferase
MINFKIFTIFPELFPQILANSITGEALNKNLWKLEVINIRDYGFDARKTVDDAPFGGGAGMVFRPDVLHNALSKNIIKNSENIQKPKIIYPSPRGKVFNQKMAQELSQESEINIICGRYEGIDQRIIDIFEIEEISIGDYVLSGGEIASYVLIDAILRNVKGVLGKEQSLDQESFGNIENNDYEFLLEYPHYTRPANFLDKEVPVILLSGHHANIEKWRKEKAEEITQKNRPDLFEKYLLSKNKKS